MDQTYVVLRPSRAGEVKRDVLFRFGKFCYRDTETNLGVKTLTLDNFSLVLKVLQQRQGSMPFLCRDHDLGKFPQFMNPIKDARSAATFCGAELARCEDKLKTLAEFGMTAWIDDDFGAFFLDVPLTAHKMQEYKDVELVVAKMFIDHILWCVVYHSGKFLITLSEASGEHELLNTHFPIISNPHKEFPVEKYTNPHAAYRALTLMYSPMSGAAAQKTADVVDVEPDSSEDEEEERAAIEDEMFAGDKNGPVFRDGYHQTYIVQKPRGRTTRRSVFVRCGNWCYDGNVDLGQVSLSLSDVPMAIPILQAQQGSLRYVSEFSRLSKSSPYRRPLVHLVRVAGFIEEQVATEAVEQALMQLSTLSSGSPTKAPNPDRVAGIAEAEGADGRMVAGEAPDEYFELELTDACKVYKNVEMLASKTYVRGIILILVYFDGHFYCTMGEGQGDQPLLDVAFPDMSRRGGGCMIGTYDHPYFRKFSVWQGTEALSNVSPKTMRKLQDKEKAGRTIAGNGRGRAMDRRGRESGSGRGMASKMADANDEARRSKKGGTVADGNTRTNEGESELVPDGQTYIVFHHPDAAAVDDIENMESLAAGSLNESTRPAFFRFGGWCYGGNVVVKHGPGEMTMESLVNVLPGLGEQQRGMSFSTELERLPTGSRQYLALLRLQHAAEYLLDQLVAAEAELDKLRTFLTTRGQTPWVDDESRNVYFELQFTTEGSEPLKCVEVAASKMHINGVVISTMYFGGTLYATLESGATGEHALLDSSFPDVTTKGRGYTIGAAPHSYFKKFSVWEGKEEGNSVGVASSPKSSGTSSSRGGPAFSDSGSSSGGSPSERRLSGSSAGSKSSDRVPAGAKRADEDTSERVAAFNEGKTSGDAPFEKAGQALGFGQMKLSGRRLAPLRQEIGPGGFGAKPNPRLAPLGESMANRQSFSGLKPLKNIGASAPWDAMGRPKLGAIGTSSGSGGRNNKK